MSAGSRRSSGWHRLDPWWAQRLVRESGVGPGDLVLDIGAGTGAITAPLIASGARVIAIERDPQRAAALRARFGDQVTVVEGDTTTLPLPRRGFHVVANPPFAVTSALLRRLLQPGSSLLSAQLVLDHRAALRWGRPGAPGERRWRQAFAFDVGIRLPGHAFHPPPKTTTCRLVAIRRAGRPYAAGRGR